MGLVKSDKSSAFVCFPLAVAGLVAGTIFTVFAVYSLVDTLNNRRTQDVSAIFQIVFAVLQLLFGVFTIVGVLFRKPALCAFGVKLCFIWCGVVVLALLTSWYYWAVQIAKKDYNADMEKWVDKDYNLTTKDYVWMGIGTLVDLLLIALLIYMASIFASLSRVFAAGGSGWRLQSAQDVKSEKALNSPSPSPVPV